MRFGLSRVAINTSLQFAKRVEKIDVELLDICETRNARAGARLDHHVFVRRMCAAAVSESTHHHRQCQTIGKDVIWCATAEPGRHRGYRTVLVEHADGCLDDRACPLSSAPPGTPRASGP